MQTFAERVVGGFVTRCIYFAGTLVTVPVLTALIIALGQGRDTTVAPERAAPLYTGTILSPFPTSTYWLTVLVLALLVAILGPRRLRPWQRRPSARLHAIEKVSQMPGSCDLQQAPPLAEPLQRHECGTGNSTAPEEQDTKSHRRDR